MMQKLNIVLTPENVERTLRKYRIRNNVNLVQFLLAAKVEEVIIQKCSQMGSETNGSGAIE